MKAGMIDRVIAVGVLVLLAGAGTGWGELVEVPLDCAGQYDPTSISWDGEFDLGVEFVDIAAVFIDWSLEITAGLAEPEGGGEPYPLEVGIRAVLGGPPNWRYTEVYGGESTYPLPEVFDVRSELVYAGMPLSELFDGQGTIGLRYTRLIIIGGMYVEGGSVTVNSASLVVEGTVVPEPSVFGLGAAGAVAWWRRKRRPRRG